MKIKKAAALFLSAQRVEWGLLLFWKRYKSLMRKIFKRLVFILGLVTCAVSIAATPVAARHGMVVTEQHLATQVGVDILRAGGNAVDAAVAVGYALAVVNPCCGNLGGGGFMLLRLTNGKSTFINYRERAPLAAYPAMYQDKDGNVIPDKSTIGYRAVATPGTVLGLETALKKFGTMTRQQVMAPAIRLAQSGFVLAPGDISIMKSHTAEFAKNSNIAAIFLNHGKAYQAGDKLVQTDLAASLRAIARDGAAAFYHGKIAAAIVSASKKNGGILTQNDFNDYKVELLSPLNCSYRGYSIISSPPPSSGGVTLCEMLNILEGYPLKTYSYNSPVALHYILEAMRFAFADRNSKLGDPDFVANPITQLISKNYAAKIRRRIPADRAVDSAKINETLAEHEGVHTTHYTIADKAGNVVAVTYTLNSFFGAQVIAGDTGFFLNDEMDDFTAKLGAANKFGLVEGDKNNIEPGKRPLSSMTPTIIMEKGLPLLVTGSPGGPRIITATLEVILNFLDYGMNIQDAVNAPRYHEQWLPDVVYLEPGGVFTEPTLKQLGSMGYHFETGPRQWGAAQSIYLNHKTGMLYGAIDIRRPAGAAIGY
jgi:gamma-glutamyltranspeptidase/glutathione hydrolase